MKKPKPITETAFAVQVVELFRLYNWRFMHMSPARTGKGAWVTRTNPEGVGFPDYIAVHEETQRILFAELKDEKSEPTPAQKAWLGDLGVCDNLEVFLWRPSMLEEIAEVLKGE